MQHLSTVTGTWETCNAKKRPCRYSKTSIHRQDDAVQKEELWAAVKKQEAAAAQPNLTVRDFGFPENIVESFTNYDCDRLAVAVAREGNYPLALVGGEFGGYVHVGNYLGDNLVLDIEGVHKFDSWVDRWAELGDYDDLEEDDEFDGYILDQPNDLKRTLRLERIKHLITQNLF
jgi:hypothetical protein